MYAIPTSSGSQNFSNATPPSHLGKEIKAVALVMEMADASHLDAMPKANLLALS
jgi:hypothetical protein